jgi:hypothetical protein
MRREAQTDKHFTFWQCQLPIPQPVKLHPFFWLVDPFSSYPTTKYGS